MTTPPDDADVRIASATTAWRPRAPGGRILDLPAWHDLSPSEREAAFAETLAQRALEAALDPRGLSATAHAVLARLDL